MTLSRSIYATAASIGCVLRDDRRVAQITRAVIKHRAPYGVGRRISDEHARSRNRLMPEGRRAPLLSQLIGCDACGAMCRSGSHQWHPIGSYPSIQV